MAATDLEKRLEALEQLAAHQEKTIDDLNEVVTQQGDELALLKARLTRTQDKLKSVEELAQTAGQSDAALSISDLAAQEKPPHY